MGQNLGRVWLSNSSSCGICDGGSVMASFTASRLWIQNIFTCSVVQTNWPSNMAGLQE